jgi:hypothetical protein
VITDFKIFLNALTVPIEEDFSGFDSSLAPNAARELRGILPDTFLEKVMNGTTKLTMEFTAHYQNEQGQPFEAFSVWQFKKSTMGLFMIEQRAN